MATAKKKPVSPEAKLEARRKLARERKARQRAAAGGLQARREQAAIEQLDCIDWDHKLQPHIQVVEHGAGQGCWLWRGGYNVVFGNTRPVVRSGQYGRQYADVAVWCAHYGRTHLPPGSFLKRICGNRRCVSPWSGHALVTNRTVENAKKRRMKAGGQHVQEPRQGHEGHEGHEREGQLGRRLPRAV